MNGLVTAAGVTVVDRLLRGDPPLAVRSKEVDMLMGVCFLLVLAAFGFGMVGLYFQLANVWPPEAVSFVLAGTFLAASLLIAAGVYILMKRRQSRISQARREIMGFVEKLTQQAEAEFGQPIRENPVPSVALATMAGFLAGERFL